jgi:hypothetical protein
MTDIKKYLGKIKLVENILRTLKPKEVIAHYSKIYLISFLKDNGFDFKENQLEFHRKKPEFKQIIYFGCSRNNITGHIIDFDMGFYNYCPRFQLGTINTMDKTSRWTVNNRQRKDNGRLE